MVGIVRGRSAVYRKYILPQMAYSCFCANIFLNIEGTVDGRWILNSLSVTKAEDFS